MQDDTGPDFPEQSKDERPALISWSEVFLVFLFLGLIAVLGLAVQRISGAFPR